MDWAVSCGTCNHECLLQFLKISGVLKDGPCISVEIKVVCVLVVFFSLVGISLFPSAL